MPDVPLYEGTTHSEPGLQLVTAIVKLPAKFQEHFLQAMYLSEILTTRTPAPISLKGLRRCATYADPG